MIDTSDPNDSSTCAGDQDSDAVCDDIDLCPTVFDPGQVDLDQDHIGWACDPVETVALPVVGGITYLKAEHVRDTFGASVASCTGEDCLRVAFGVSPLGSMVVRSDSTAAGDAWLASSRPIYSGIQGPFISRDERLFWSTRTLTSNPTGELDLSTGTYSERSTDEVWRRSDARLPADLLVLGTTMAKNLVAPQGGQLAHLATSAMGFAPTPELQLATTAGIPTIAIPEIDGGKYKLSRYVPATGTLEVVDSEIDALVHRQPRVRDELAYCAKKGAQAHYLGVSASGITRAPLPFDACFGAGPVGDSFAGSWFMIGVDEGDNDLGVAFVHGGQISTVFSNEARGTVGIFGTELRAVAVTDASGGARVWAVTPTGTVVPIPNSLAKVQVSAHGNTVHIVGVQAGNVVLIRYRVASGLQTIQIAPVFSTTTPKVFTTYEGAAIIGAEQTHVVPSTSSTPATLALFAFDLDVRVRGTSTVVHASPPAGIGPRAMYAYDELVGPRITSLVTTSSVIVPAANLDDDHASEWFLYPTTELQLARIRYNGTTPGLDTYPVGNDGSFRIVGRRANGDLVATAYGGVYILDASGVTRVARDIGSPIAIIDEFSSPPVVVGWKGTDAAGPYACLASHPDRCWAGVGEEFAVTAQGDGSFALVSLVSTSSSATLTVLRPIGTGNRPQPL